MSSMSPPSFWESSANVCHFSAFREPERDREITFALEQLGMIERQFTSLVSKTPRLLASLDQETQGLADAGHF